MKRTIVHFVVALCLASLVRADQTVQSVQQALKDQGFYYGNVTGDKSAETTAAVRRYQIRNGLQVTGEINPETLRSLNLSSNAALSSHPTSKPAVTRSNSARPDDSSRLGQNPSQPRPPAEPDRRLEMNPVLSGNAYQSAPPRMNRRIIVAQMQRELMSRGYYWGRIDGSYGRRTAFAVRAFQLGSGLQPTGRLDASTLDALGLSDWNMAYLQSLPYPYANWMPVKKFEHGQWREEWDKHHRDDDEYNPYGISERADKEFEYGKQKEEWEEQWKKQDDEREKKWEVEWKKQEEWAKKREEWNKKKWEERWKKHHREVHKHGDKHGKGHGQDRWHDHGHDDD
jgi:peptidoglycan hydrolase-like protein with peptidoglycan-binding domain